MFSNEHLGKLPECRNVGIEIHKLIYTTNIIESYHRQLRKVTKGKSIFPSDEALLKMLQDIFACMNEIETYTKGIDETIIWKIIINHLCWSVICMVNSNIVSSTTDYFLDTRQELISAIV